MKNEKLLRWLNLYAVIAIIVFNALANAIPFNNKTTGEISDQFQVYFVPAGYVFSIWGLIYFALAVFAIYQLLPGELGNKRIERIGYLFIASSIANICWLFSWHYEMFSLSVVIMLVLLVSLVAIYLRLDIGRVQASSRERWFLEVPFSLYLGWITVATIANITTFLDYTGWEGWGIPPETWAMLLLIITAIVGVLVTLTRRDAVYMGVFVWALAGIAVKQAETAVVANTAWVMTAVAGFLLVVAIMLHQRYFKGNQSAASQHSQD